MDKGVPPSGSGHSAEPEPQSVSAQGASVPNADDQDDPYWEYDENDCWNCGGEGYVYGCSWDWQCDTYDEGEGTCLCMRLCHICNPPKPNPELQKILGEAIASAKPCGRCHGDGVLYRQDCGAHGLTQACPNCAGTGVAQGTEAGTAETEGLGPKDESAVPEGNASGKGQP